MYLLSSGLDVQGLETLGTHLPVLCAADHATSTSQEVCGPGQVDGEVNLECQVLFCGEPSQEVRGLEKLGQLGKMLRPWSFLNFYRTHLFS